MTNPIDGLRDGSDLPPAGSPEAILRDCCCPVRDYRYGHGVPSEHGPLYWYAADCPLHGENDAA